MENADLTPDNVHAYWEYAWGQNLTGWKAAEQSKPFMRNVQKYLEARALRNGSPSAATDDDVAAFVKGKVVLVPLCGDTFAVRFFVDQGAALVVGVDLSETAIRRSLESNFGIGSSESSAFEVLEETVASVAGAGAAATCKKFSVFDKECREGARCIFYVGDFFTAPMGTGCQFDLVYDRASMVALPPSLREQYVTTIHKYIADKVDVLLELVRRRNGAAQLQHGPPFHIPSDVVIDHYRSVATSVDFFEVDTALVDAFVNSSAESAPPGERSFVFAWFALQIQK